jgi:uncharacterized protein YegJ (DUF2314 family)
MSIFQSPYRSLAIGIAVFVMSAAYYYLKRNFWSDPVVAFDKDDPAHVAAIETAQATLGTFWEAVRAVGSEGALCGLKVGLDADQGKEHVWLFVGPESEVTKTGVLANRPQVLDLREGELVHFRDDQISDWMVRDAESTKGAFTIRAMLQKLPDRQARQVAESHGIEM